VDALPLTGERTLPGVDAENYWFRRHEAAYRWVARELPVGGATVVEAGCGEGYGGQLLAEAGAVQVVGLDLDQPSLSHVAAAYPGVHPVRANLVSLPLAAGCADVVVSSQVVEHLWDQNGFVRECARVLRPGGRLALTTPNRLTFPPGNVFHHRELDAGELAGLVADHLEVEQVLGVRHGQRLAADDAAYGDLVAAQVAAAATGDGSGVGDDGLRARVAAVTADDFVVDDHDLADCLDLVLVAVRR
jgi:SAM-dependent methyltransferase